MWVRHFWLRNVRILNTLRADISIDSIFIPSSMIKNDKEKQNDSIFSTYAQPIIFNRTVKRLRDTVEHEDRKQIKIPKKKEIR